jgi:hypothetical protein
VASFPRTIVCVFYEALGLRSMRKLDTVRNGSVAIVRATA